MSDVRLQKNWMQQICDLFVVLKTPNLAQTNRSQVGAH